MNGDSIGFIRHAKVFVRNIQARRVSLQKHLDSSAVSRIFIAVTIWITAAVLLTMASRLHTIGTLELSEGNRARRGIVAKIGFSYTDTMETAALINRELEEIPFYFKISKDANDRILTNFDTFFASDKGGNSEALPVWDKWRRAFAEDEEALRNFRHKLNSVLASGVLPAGEYAAMPAGHQVRVMDSDGRILNAKPAGIHNNPRKAGVSMAEYMLSYYADIPAEPSDIEEAAYEFERLIGGEGNLIRNDYFRAEEQKKHKAELTPVKHDVKAGEILVHEDELVSRGIADKLSGYAAAVRGDMNCEWRQFAYHAWWSLVLVIFGAFYMHHLHSAVVKFSRRLFLLGFVIVVSMLANYGSYLIFCRLASRYSIPDALVAGGMPIAFGAVLLAVTMGYRVSVCAGFFTSSIAAMMLWQDRSFDFAIKGMVVCGLAALFVRNSSDYREFFRRTMAAVTLLCCIVNLNLCFDWQGYAAADSTESHAEDMMAQDDSSVFTVYESGQIVVRKNGLLLVAGISLVNGLTTAIASLLMIFLMESFNVSTNMALMLLCSGRHKLIERLKREAPGTFAHSMAVATLAEDAAAAIGANPLIAKAGAMFHDIGKLIHPEYFTENNPDSNILHDRKTPYMSSMIIINHTKAGMRLASRYRMCSTITDAVSQHHGNDLVRFFYEKARQEAGGAEIDESKFRYHGAPPKSREMVIISLADACEAASRSLKGASQNTLEKEINGIFFGRFKGGQLVNSDITLNELAKIRNSFIKTLSAMLHVRVAYDKKDNWG